MSHRCCALRGAGGADLFVDEACEKNARLPDVRFFVMQSDDAGRDNGSATTAPTTERGAPGRAKGTRCCRR